MVWDFFLGHSSSRGGGWVINFWGVCYGQVMLYNVGFTKLYLLSCLIILTSIYRLGRLRINYTAGTRQPGFKPRSVWYLHLLFALCVLLSFSHHISLYQVHIETSIWEKKYECQNLWCRWFFKCREKTDLPRQEGGRWVSSALNMNGKVIL